MFSESRTRASVLIVILTITILATALMTAPTGSGELPGPTNEERQLFQTKKDRYNGRLAPRPVDDILNSLGPDGNGKWVTIASWECNGTDYDRCEINIKTRLVNFNCSIGEINADGKFGRESAAVTIVGRVKRLNITFYLMIKAAIAKELEGTVAGQVDDDRLFYHELLHGQILVDEMKKPDWQGRVYLCKCRPISEWVSLTDPADPKHITITSLEATYMKNVADARKLRLVYDSAIVQTEHNGSFRVVVEIPPEILEKENLTWSFLAFKVEDLNFTEEDHNLTITGKLVNCTTLGMVWVIFDPDNVGWIIRINIRVPPTEPHDANAVWVDPSFSVFDTFWAHVGYRFNVTVCANLTEASYTWQVKMLFNNTQLNARRAGYTANATSQFFKNLNTSSVTPVINNTAGYVLHAESLKGAIQREPGYGSLCWVEFEVLATPPNRGNLTSQFNITTTDTYVLNPSFNPISLTPYDGFFIYWSHSDIAITNITRSKTVVGQGSHLSINITMKNQGDYNENFNITVCANTTAIATLMNINLTSGNSTTISFTWNTIGFAKGNYTINADATPVPSETDTTDNTHIDGWVIITIPGDVNGDKTVNILDCIILANHFGHANGNGHTPDTKEWKNCMNTDINSDNRVNILDCIILAGHFGETTP